MIPTNYCLFNCSIIARCLTFPRLPPLSHLLPSLPPLPTKLTQGKRFRVMRGKVMGVPEEYDDDVERRRTHPLLMPKVESERISAADGEILEKAAIVAPAKLPAKNPKKGILYRVQALSRFCRE